MAPPPKPPSSSSSSSSSSNCNSTNPKPKKSSTTTTTNCKHDSPSATLENLSSDEIDRLPWKGVREGNPDYQCLTDELRQMAPTNGRVVLLFRARSGCPVANLEGWGLRKESATRSPYTVQFLMVEEIIVD